MGTRMTMIAVKARAFPRSNRGNVAMMFAVATVPLTVAAGVGLDYSRAILVREQMSEALDAAALAVGPATCLTLSQAQTLAQEYFIANYTVDQTAFGNPSVTITARARSC